MWLAFAGAAAVCFGLRGILYQLTSRRPLDRNVLLLGVYLCGTFIALLFSLLTRPSWTPEVLTGLAMGIFSFVANASMFRAFAVGKASLVAVLTSLPAVVVIALSYLLWGETLTPGQGVAFVVLVSGVVLIRYASDLSLQDRKGAGWALAAMLAFGLTDVSSKQAMLWGADTLPTLVVMYATGALLFAGSWYRGRLADAKARKAVVSALGTVNAGHSEQAAARTEADESPTRSAAAGRQERTAAAEQSPEPEFEPAAAALASAAAWPFGRTLAWGLVVGLSNISGMLFILPAFRLGVTGLVSAVVAMNVLLVLLYARFFLNESFSRKEAAGMTLAVGGMLLLRLIG
ncbi:hypothetical protein J31TS4_12180 [Paenibacillus sp. J31TS4]|uniref:EamA family transporter n=1 Tax=Paenibacillus sp. J31TS4 TaxID=2807195 RepID=UPI001B215DB1|nr:DMT family transporter [Paenibacillus sp. J31TS4]GIP37938.1 hypothetical protein J31TS4_12180 [Paenibacillus sp. J31TS4]